MDTGAKKIDSFIDLNTLPLEITATGCVLSPDQQRVLLIFHKKLRVWTFPGGHVESGEAPHRAVIREVFEETGIEACLVNYSPQLELQQVVHEIQVPSPAFVLHEYIPARSDRNEHTHYDFIYFLQAAHENIKPDLNEIEGIRWTTFEELETLETFPSVKAIMRILKK